MTGENIKTTTYTPGGTQATMTCPSRGVSSSTSSESFGTLLHHQHEDPPPPAPTLNLTNTNLITNNTENIDVNIHQQENYYVLPSENPSEKHFQKQIIHPGSRDDFSLHQSKQSTSQPAMRHYQTLSHRTNKFSQQRDCQDILGGKVNPQETNDKSYLQSRGVPDGRITREYNYREVRDERKGDDTRRTTPSSKSTMESHYIYNDRASCDVDEVGEEDESRNQVGWHQNLNPLHGHLLPGGAGKLSATDRWIPVNSEVIVPLLNKDRESSV